MFQLNACWLAACTASGAVSRVGLSVAVLAVWITINPEAVTGLMSDLQGQLNLTRVQAAASAGDANAMCTLAEKYWRGDGVTRDSSQAVVWYRKAAELGSGEAMVRLGFFYENGSVVPKNHEQAVAWYQRAVDAGNEAAMFHLGVMLWSGRGVPQDLVEAYKWLDLSSAHASGETARENASARDALARVMSAEGIALARKRARNWQAAYDLRKKTTSVTGR